MLRMIPVLILCSSTVALADEPSVQPSAPPSAVALQPAPAQATETAASIQAADTQEAAEEPQVKKVCRAQEVVGSAIPRTVCVMKPIRTPKG